MDRDGDDLRAYYAGAGGHDEWARLTRPPGSVEFAVNSRAITSYLPPGARVLDRGRARPRHRDSQRPEHPGDVPPSAVHRAQVLVAHCRLGVGCLAAVLTLS